MTTTTQVDHRESPVLYHLGRDPGEKYPIRSWSAEYKEQVAILRQIAHQHQSELKVGEPQLNWCDAAVMVRKN